MGIKKVNSRQYFNTINIIFGAIVASLVIFSSICFMVHTRSLLDTNDSLKSVFIYIIPFSIALGFILSNILYKSQLRLVNSNDLIIEKMKAFQKAYIIRLAILEGPALLAIVAYLITAYQLFLILALVIVFYLITIRPTRSLIIEDLSLNALEKRKIDNPEEILMEIEDPNF